MNLVLLNIHNIFPAPQEGGIEKRIEAFVKFCKNNNIKLYIISSKKINLENYTYINSQSEQEFIFNALNLIKHDDKVISYNLSIEALKILDRREIKTINANCSGLAKGQRPTNFVYSSENIKNRFLSLNQKISYDGFYEEKYSCVIPHGLNDEEFYFNEELQTKKYFLWCASLGWGLQSKGLDVFLNLAKLNPNDKFIAYGASWNSDDIENYLKSLNLENFKFLGSLTDDKKNEVFSNAIALCQFTRLIESCNIITLESYSRGTPVITLDEDQGGVTNNAKFFDLTLTEYKDFERLKERSLSINRKEIFDFYKKSFHCKNEYDTIIKEFNK